MQTAGRYCPTPSGRLPAADQTARAGEGAGRRGHVPGRWARRWAQPLCEAGWRGLGELQVEFPQHPAAPLLGVYLMGIKSAP